MNRCYDYFLERLSLLYSQYRLIRVDHPWSEDRVLPLASDIHIKMSIVSVRLNVCFSGVT